MFGDSLLICPKLTNSTIDSQSGDHIFPIDCIFPKESLWYFWYAPLAFQGSSERQLLELNDLEQGIWVNGGSIIPSLYRFDAMSLLHALTNPMSLGIYLDEKREASTQIYIDDGQTFEYQTDQQSSLVEFKFTQNTLFWHKNEKSGTYEPASQKEIIDLSLYGISEKPSQILDL